MISGRQAIVVSFPSLAEKGKINQDLRTEEVLQLCCTQLGLSSIGSMRLVSGDDVVPGRTLVHDWPGIRACGEISEYQLVVQQS
eukprot:1773559-Amphidinium_carterae.1